MKIKNGNENKNDLLPAKKSVVSESINDFIWCFFGDRKIGKSLTASMFENTLFLPLEPGHKSMSIYKTKPITSWEQFMSIIVLLEQDEKYETIAIDPCFPLYNLCYEYTLRELDIEDIKEDDWGSAWSVIRKNFEDSNNRLVSIGKGIIYIAHSEVTVFKRKGGMETHKFKMDLGKQAKRYIAGIVDIIVFFHYDENGNRVMTIEGDDYNEAGHRCKDHFKYTNGDRVRNIPMGDDESEAHENLMLAFSNKLKKLENLK